MITKLNEYSSLNINMVLEITDIYDQLILEFEIYDNVYIGSVYNHEYPSVSPEINDSYHVEGEEKVTELYELISSILDNYFCLIEIDKENWLTIVNKYFPDKLNKEKNRFNMKSEDECNKIINEYEKEFFMDNLKKEFNI